MSTFALIHGGGGSAWDWHLVAPELRERGYDAVALDLPSEDESAGWWDYADAVVEAVGDRGDVPPELSAEAQARERDQADKPLEEPWPLEAWPDVPTRYLLCRDDRMLTPDWARRRARTRLDVEPDEMDGGHYVSISRPRELAERLDAYAASLGSRE